MSAVGQPESALCSAMKQCRKLGKRINHKQNNGGGGISGGGGGGGRRGSLLSGSLGESLDSADDDDLVRCCLDVLRNARQSRCVISMRLERQCATISALQRQSGTVVCIVAGLRRKNRTTGHCVVCCVSSVESSRLIGGALTQRNERTPQQQLAVLTHQYRWQKVHSCIATTIAVTAQSPHSHTTQQARETGLEIAERRRRRRDTREMHFVAPHIQSYNICMPALTTNGSNVRRGCVHYATCDV